MDIRMQHQFLTLASAIASYTVPCWLCKAVWMILQRSSRVVSKGSFNALLAEHPIVGFTAEIFRNVLDLARSTCHELKSRRLLDRKRQNASFFYSRAGDKLSVM